MSTIMWGSPSWSFFTHWQDFYYQPQTRNYIFGGPKYKPSTMLYSMNTYRPPSGRHYIYNQNITVKQVKFAAGTFRDFLISSILLASNFHEWGDRGHFTEYFAS